jgi:predicted dithiol-disulfide oxidoreductase (DUF899 family)
MRRRQPMTEFRADYEFDGPDGRVALLDLFEGRPQLIVYHFWHPPGGEPCTGCSMFADQISELAHLHARDVTLALVSTAPRLQIEAFKQRMGWVVPWYTGAGSEFQEACDTTDYFALDVFLRDGDRVFLTYMTRGRGVEELGSVWTFVDLTPFGRQEEWEDTPPGPPAVAALSVVAEARPVGGERMTFAHVAGVPVEELLWLAPATSALWLALRSRIHAAATSARAASRIAETVSSPCPLRGVVQANRRTSARSARASRSASAARPSASAWRSARTTSSG